MEPKAREHLCKYRKGDYDKAHYWGKNLIWVLISLLIAAAHFVEYPYQLVLIFAANRLWMFWVNTAAWLVEELLCLKHRHKL